MSAKIYKKIRRKCYSFFRNFGEKNSIKYSSVRPSKKPSGSTVTDIRVLKYFESKILYKLNLAELPCRTKKIDFTSIDFPPLFKSKLLISKTKFDHLQAIKSELPKDYWSFYDLLPPANEKILFL